MKIHTSNPKGRTLSPKPPFPKPPLTARRAVPAIGASLISPDYAAFVADLKSRITSAHLSAARSVNRELILLYWDIGQAIVEKQRTAKWGDSIVEQIAADLRHEFPDMRGFSSDDDSRAIGEEVCALFCAHTETDRIDKVLADAAN